MPDPKVANIQIHGSLDRSFTEAIAQARRELDGLAEQARSLRIAAGAPGTPGAPIPAGTPFPSLGKGGGPTAPVLAQPVAPPAVKPPTVPVPPSAQPLPPRRDNRMPSPTWWDRMAMSLLPSEGIVRQILKPGGRHAAQHAEPTPRAATGNGTAADAMARTIEDRKQMRTAVERGTRAGLGAAMAGMFDLLRFGRSPAPPQVATPPTAPTVYGGIRQEDRQALYDRLRAAGATAKEAAQTAGLPVPKSASSSLSDLTAAALGLESGGLLSRGIKSATGPLGSLLGVGALAGGVAYGLQFAPPAAALGQQMGASPNGAYQSLLSNPAVRSGIATPDEMLATSSTLLQAGGRMMGRGQTAALALFKDANAAARFARGIGITANSSAALLGALTAAGIIQPGGAAAITPSLVGAAQASGLPGSVFASGLSQFVSTVSPYAVPTAAASLLANTASFGQQFGIPALSGNRAAGTLGAISGSIASGSMLQGLPGPIMGEMLAALSPGGKMPTTIGGVFRAYQGGLTTPGQEARFFGVLRQLYGSSPATRNYAVLNQLLQPLGGYGSAQSAALEKNVLALPQNKFDAAMSALQSNPSAAPGALSQAVAAYRQSYGGAATGISGALQVAGGETFAGLSKPLSDLSSAVRGLTSPAKAIAAELGAGIALNLSSAAIKALLGKGGGGGGGAAGGFVAGLAGSSVARAAAKLGKAVKGAGNAAVEAATGGGLADALAGGAVVAAPVVAAVEAALTIPAAGRGIAELVKHLEGARVSLLPGTSGPSVTLPGGGSSSTSTTTGVDSRALSDFVAVVKAALADLFDLQNAAGARRSS